MRNIDILNIGQIEETPEGYIKARAIVTTTGIFKYLTTDGRVVKQYRPAEAVGDPESIESLKMRPVTMGHPPVWVNADNAKKYQIGTTGETVEFDSSTGNLIATFIITDAEAIKKIKDGIRQLSLGYDLELQEAKGNADGEDYDFIVSNIRYNHLAVVNKARAGEITTLQLDSSEEFYIQETQTNNKKEPEMGKKITINGVEHQVDDAVATLYADTVKQRDEAMGAGDGLRAENEKLKAQVAALEAEIKKGKAPSKEEMAKKVNDEVAARLDLIKKVEKAANKDAAELLKLTPRQMKIEAIKNMDDAFEDKEDLSDDYITGRFEAALIIAQNSDEADNDEDQSSASDQARSFNKRNKNEDSIDELDVDAAYARQLARYNEQ